MTLRVTLKWIEGDTVRTREVPPSEIYKKTPKEFHDPGCKGFCKYCLMTNEIMGAYGTKEKKK
jgi:hypothetical protein